MNYSKACELLGFTTPKGLADNARLAESRQKAFNLKTPLRYKVAVSVLINAAK